MTLGDRRRIQEAMGADNIAAADQIREDRRLWTIANFKRTNLFTGSKVGMPTK